MMRLLWLLPMFLVWSCGSEEPITPPVDPHAGHDHGTEGHNHDTIIISYEDYINTGELLLDDRDYELASLQFLDATRKDSTRVEGWYGLAYCMSQIGSNAKAIEYFDHVIELDSAYRQALTNRGNCKVKIGKAGEAMNDLNSAIIVNPECGPCYLNRAFAFAAMEQTDDLCVDLSKAIELGVEEAKELQTEHCK
jgi:tetratricopeptide (TPR) repeat protein